MWPLNPRAPAQQSSTLGLQEAKCCVYTQGPSLRGLLCHPAQAQPAGPLPAPSLLTHMVPLVLNKVCSLVEGLPTALALVGLLPSVDPLVLREVGAAEEGFATDLALVGLLSRVDPFVLREG